MASKYRRRSRAIAVGLLTLALGAARDVQAAETLRVRGRIPETFACGMPVPVAIPVDLKVAFGSLAQAIVAGGATLRIAEISGAPQVRSAGPAQFAPAIDRDGRVQARGMIWCLLECSPEALGRPIVLTIAADASRPAFGSVSLLEWQRRWFRFMEVDRPVLQLNHVLVRPPVRPERYAAADFVHPLWGLDGEPITQSFPGDHRHHRGLFWAWPRVMKDGKPIGDLWHLRQIWARFERVLWRRRGPLFAELAVENAWVCGPSRDEARKVVAEHVRIRVFPAGKLGRCIDIELALRALQPGMSIGGQLSKDKGYGGFTLRLARPWYAEIRMDGVKIAKDVNRQRARWSDYSGWFRRPAAPTATSSAPTRRAGRVQAAMVSGVAVFAHPSLPDFPPGWSNRYYGILNPAFPGLKAYPLPQDEPLRLRFRLYVHRYDSERARVDDQYEAYVADFGWRMESVGGR